MLVVDHRLSTHRDLTAHAFPIAAPFQRKDHMVSLPRRPATAHDLFAQGYLSPDKTSVADAEAFLAFLCTHDLELSPAVRDAYLIRTAKKPMPESLEDYTSAIYVPTAVFFRICRATGLWMPGSVSFTGSGEDLVCTATCHSRLTTNDAWVTVGAHARMFVYYRRGPDGQTPDPRWALTPDLALAETASVLAAQKALGRLVADLNTEATTLEFAMDRRVQARIGPQGAFLS